MKIYSFQNSLEFFKKKEIIGEILKIRKINEGIVHDVYLLNSKNGKSYYLKIRLDHFKTNKKIKINPFDIKYEFNSIEIINKICGDLGPHVLFYKNNFLLLENIKENKNHYVYDLLYKQKLSPKQSFYIGNNINKIHKNLKRCKQTIRSKKLEYQQYNNYLYWRYGFCKNRNIDFVVEKIKNRPNKQLIYGDFNPKNMVIKDDSLRLCDFETVHWGDPLFDIAFFVGHLIYSSLNKIEYSQKLVERFLENFCLNKEEEFIVTNLSIATIYYRIKTNYRYKVNFSFNKKILEKLIKGLLKTKPATFKEIFLYLRNNLNSIF